MSRIITEYLNPLEAQVVVESDGDEHKGKNLYMKGIFIQGDIRNHNGRIYPKEEIAKAVAVINEQIKNGISVVGEADHPEQLVINLDRISHVITEMHMQDSAGYGTLKILPTPKGNIIKTLLENGIKLGVSSRGSGEVDFRGFVKDFSIVTIDIVVKPSGISKTGKELYPDIVYESMHNRSIRDLAESVIHDPKAQKHLSTELLKFIEKMKF